MLLRNSWMLLASLTLISGCASTEQKPDISDEQIELRRDLIVTLEKYSAKALEAKEMTLSHQSAMLQLQSTPSDIYEITRDRMKVIQGLDKSIPLKAFQQDIEEPLRLIAALTNYEIDFSTRPAHTTVWVKAPKATRSAQDWIWDFHGQAGGRIDIEIFPNKDAILSDGSLGMGDVKNGKIFVTFHND